MAQAVADLVETVAVDLWELVLAQNAPFALARCYRRLVDTAVVDVAIGDIVDEVTFHFAEVADMRKQVVMKRVVGLVEVGGQNSVVDKLASCLECNNLQRPWSIEA